MTAPRVQVRELAAWAFDEYKWRPSDARPRGSGVLQDRAAYTQASVIASAEWDPLRTSLRPHATRPDLLEEMRGLSWSLDVIDLRALLCFQRRLAFDPQVEEQPVPRQDNAWELIACAFGPSQTPVYDSERADSRTLLLRSGNPNLEVRFSAQSPSLTVSCGSPFLEVAEFRSRWFLRDGYHRAYRLLRQGVPIIPAVIVRARTLEELGAAGPRFFHETTLFSGHPPRVLDFLDDRLNLTYARLPLVKTLRLTMDESFDPPISSGEQT